MAVSVIHLKTGKYPINHFTPSSKEVVRMIEMEKRYVKAINYIYWFHIWFRIMSVYV